MKNNNKIKISEIFESVQGEGRYAGTPMLFIRTSGCTRACSWCDTKYHNQGEFISTRRIIQKIRKSKLNVICWTGGEPLLQKKQIKQIVFYTPNKKHHIETNGDLLIKEDLSLFDYLAISPKDLAQCKKVLDIITTVEKEWDIKIVTDLEKEGKWGLDYATMLMPLTTYTSKDKEIQRSIWNYCVEHNLKFTPRYQTWIFGKKKGV